MPKSRRSSAELHAMREHVRACAAMQGGVFRRSDLASWGIEPTAVLAMRRNGTWVRLHHGVYADIDIVTAATTPAAMHLLRAAAAVAAIPGPVALFGPTSSLHLGLPVDRNAVGPVELVRPLGRDSRALRRRVTGRDHLPTARIHVLDIDEDLIHQHDGLPVVVPTLAAWSTALASEVDWGVVALDASAWISPSNLGILAAYSRRWPQLAGAGRARQALALARPGAQTPIESLSRVRLVRAGLPEPRLQVSLYDADGLMGVVDMLFEELGVVGEADGHGKYGTRDDVIKEKSREDRIRADGFPVVRWNWQESMGDMRRVAARIWKAAEVSRRRPAA